MSTVFFRHATLESAERAASQAGRWLFLHFIAGDSAQSATMRTTWLDPVLRATVDEFAESVCLDVDASWDAVRRFEVRAVPSVVCRTPDGTLVRQITNRTADQLCVWLRSQRRYQAMGMQVRAGRADEAFDELVWHWKTAPPEVRWLDFVPMLARATEDSTRARDYFSSARNEWPGAGEPEERGMPDWLVLNEALGEVSRTLDWFDARAQSGNHLPGFARLRNAVLRRGRPADLLLFEGDRVAPRRTAEEAIRRRLDDLRRLAAQPPHDVGLRKALLRSSRLRVALLLHASAARLHVVGSTELEELSAMVRTADTSPEMAQLMTLSFEELRDSDLGLVDRRGPVTEVERL